MKKGNLRGHLCIGIVLVLAMFIMAGCSSSNTDTAAKADVELAKVAAALSAYTAAGGSAADAVYAEVTDAEAAVKAAKTGKVAADIASATENLTAKLASLTTATTALTNAIATADADLPKVAAALSAYTLAGGSMTDTVYTDVAAAETALKAARASNVAADILSATNNLTAKLAALTTATTGKKDLIALENAKAAANTEIAKVTATQSAWIQIGGSAADAVYTDVTAAQNAVIEAKTANVTAQILSTTEALTSKLTTLAKSTAAFPDAVKSINAGTATLTEFTNAGSLGVTADNLDKAKNALAGAKAVKGSDLTIQDIRTAIKSVIP